MGTYDCPSSNPSGIENNIKMRAGLRPWVSYKLAFKCSFLFGHLIPPFKEMFSQQFYLSSVGELMRTSRVPCSWKVEVYHLFIVVALGQLSWEKSWEGPRSPWPPNFHMSGWEEEGDEKGYSFLAPSHYVTLEILFILLYKVPSVTSILLQS